MNNVHDQAHALARVIKGSDEYKEYVEKKEIVYSDEENKTMVEDFREKIHELQMQELSGKEAKKEDIEKMQKLEEVLMMNSAINDFFTAELRFSQLIRDVNKIIEEAIDIEA